MAHALADTFDLATTLPFVRNDLWLVGITVMHLVAILYAPRFSGKPGFATIVPDLMMVQIVSFVGLELEETLVRRVFILLTTSLLVREVP